MLQLDRPKSSDLNICNPELILFVQLYCSDASQIQYLFPNKFSIIFAYPNLLEFIAFLMKYENQNKKSLWNFKLS